MPDTPTTTITTPAVCATYTSSSSATPHVFSLAVTTPLPANSTTQQRTAYLADLRTNAKRLQADVNKFLTERMEEDKANAGAAAAVSSEKSGKKEKEQDEIEEENYGEEVVEDD